jgi:tripartite-type tricarboxylate transporter receptor subunit TctC
LKRLIRALGGAAATILSLCASAPAGAQAYPERPVRIVVPAAAGGGLDVLMRALARDLTERWKQSVVVENRAGAGGIVGTMEALARGGNDGYTLLAATDNVILTNRFAYKNLPYDPERDLVGITLIAAADQFLLANPQLPANDLKELVALARRDGQHLNYGGWGEGSQPQLVYETLNTVAGTGLVAVQYKGVAPVMVALAANEVQLSVVSSGTAGALLQGGKAKVLAAASTQRLASYSNVATAAEQGYPDLVSMIWFAVMVPAGVPQAIQNKLNDDLQAVLSAPAFREQQITSKGWRPLPMGPREFVTAVREQAPVIEKMMRAAKVVPQ